MGLVVAFLLAFSSRAVADDAPGGSKATESLPDYSAGVRWLFMSADRDIPAHRLVQHMANYTVADLGGNVATAGEHIASRFPAGAWLETPAPPSRVHAVIRERAEHLGSVPNVHDAGASGFPLTARASVLELEARGNVVHCDVRLHLKTTSGNVIETTRFTGRGDYNGMHVFAASIPDRVWQQTERQRPRGAAATYLVMTVNVGGPDASGTTQQAQTNAH